MTRKELKLKAKASLSGNWGTAIGAGMLMFLVIFAAILVEAIIILAVLVALAGEGASSEVTYESSIASALLSGAVSAGWAWFYINMIRGNQVRVSDAFYGFKKFWRNFWANFLIGLFTFLWMLLFIIPGIIKSYSYAMTFYIFADNPDMKANDAITKSREMMDGHKMELFLLHLSFIGWMILGAFTFGVLYIWLIPYMDATIAAFYDSIKGESQPNVVEGEEEPAIAMLEE